MDEGTKPMKVFEAITAKRLKRVPPTGRFAHIEAEYDVAPVQGGEPDHFQWKYGIQLRCSFVGPEEASEHALKQARRLIAKELYGEVENELLALMRTLMEEQYRPADDPAMAIITDLLNRIRGAA